MNTGNSALSLYSPPPGSGVYKIGNGGGNSGCLISPAPGLGLSAYQTPVEPEPFNPEPYGVPSAS